MPQVYELLSFQWAIIKTVGAWVLMSVTRITEKQPNSPRGPSSSHPARLGGNFGSRRCADKEAERDCKPDP